jgi:hypothetical protein
LKESILAKNGVQIDQATSTESFHSIEAVKWFPGFVQATYGISTAGHFSTSTHKNSFNQFFAISKCASAVNSLSFLSNSFFLHQIIVRFSHIDLIFPFHYFW